MKTILGFILFLLASPSFATTAIQTQDIGGSAISWSAPATFTGAVKASSGASVNFASTLGFTTTAISPTAATTVTGSTISFTVQGTTVACWFTGQTSNSNVASSVGQSAFGMDGSIVGTYGACSAPQASPCDVNFYVEFQVTGGGTSHTFYLSVYNTAAGTTTFPSQNSNANAQWGCREVLSR